MACCFVVFCAALTGAACGQDKPGFEDKKPAPFPEADAGETASCETVKCSLDLKKVVSGCDDQVVVENATDHAFPSQRRIAPSSLTLQITPSPSPQTARSVGSSGRSV